MRAGPAVWRFHWQKAGLGIDLSVFTLALYIFVTWFESVLLLDNKNSTLSCPSNNFVGHGHLVDFRFNNSEVCDSLLALCK